MSANIHVFRVLSTAEKGGMHLAADVWSSPGQPQSAVDIETVFPD